MQDLLDKIFRYEGYGGIMLNNLDLIQRINESYPKMSKGQKLISEYILNNYDKAAFMTALKLGDRVNVSESTVVRYAMTLGYQGYPELQRAIQEMVRNKLTTIQRMEMTSELSRPMVLRSVMKADMNNIRATIDEIDTDIFEEIIDNVYAAKRVYIMGLRSSAPLAQFLGYYLNYILDNVRIVTSGINDIIEQIIHIEEDDVVICVSFPRYSRKILEAMKFASGKKAKIIAITDSLLSPLAEYAEHSLVAHSDIASFVDSLVAPFSVVNALIVALGLRKKEEVAEHFMELEKIWEEYDVYIDRE